MFKQWQRFTKENKKLYEKVLYAQFIELKELEALSEKFIDVRDGLWAQLMSTNGDRTRVRDFV